MLLNLSKKVGAGAWACAERMCENVHVRVFCRGVWGRPAGCPAPVYLLQAGHRASRAALPCSPPTPKAWAAGLTLDDYGQHSASNAKTVDEMKGMATRCAAMGRGVVWGVEGPRLTGGGGGTVYA